MSVIDTRSLDQLSTLIGGDQATLHELIETFLEEGAAIVSDMKSSLNDNNIDLLRRGAHSLKSSAQDFGASSLSELNATLEVQCKNEWPNNAAALVEEISSAFSLSAAELRQYIKSNTSQ